MDDPNKYISRALLTLIAEVEARVPNLHTKVDLEGVGVLSPMLKVQLDQTGKHLLMYAKDRDGMMQTDRDDVIQYYKDTVGLKPLGLAYIRTLHTFDGKDSTLAKVYTEEQWNMDYEGGNSQDTPHTHAPDLGDILLLAMEETLPRAIFDCVQERIRQVVAEGFDTNHDMGYTGGELAAAAMNYADAARLGIMTGKEYKGPPPCDVAVWPWDADWWKPTTPRRNLVKAAALLIAEIDRLDEAEVKSEDKPEG